MLISLFIHIIKPFRKISKVTRHKNLNLRFVVPKRWENTSYHGNYY